jgi:hypothetical protein
MMSAILRRALVDAAHRLDHLPDHLAAARGDAAGLVGQLAGLLACSALFRTVVAELLHRRGGALERRGLLLGALAQVAVALAISRGRPRWHRRRAAVRGCAARASPAQPRPSATAAASRPAWPHLAASPGSRDRGRGASRVLRATSRRWPRSTSCAASSRWYEGSSVTACVPTRAGRRSRARHRPCRHLRRAGCASPTARRPAQRAARASCAARRRLSVNAWRSASATGRIDEGRWPAQRLLASPKPVQSWRASPESGALATCVGRRPTAATPGTATGRPAAEQASSTPMHRYQTLLDEVHGAPRSVRRQVGHGQRGLRARQAAHEGDQVLHVLRVIDSGFISGDSEARF